MKIPNEMHLTQDQAENIYRVTVRIDQAIRSIIRNGKYKRIIHIARYSKKRRTRAKNLHRIGLIILKEVRDA